MRERRDCEFTAERSSKKRKLDQDLDTTPDRQHASPAQTYDTDVVQTAISSTNDALGLLFKAAEQQETDSDGSPDPIATTTDDTSGLPNLNRSTLPATVLSKPSKSIIATWNKLRFVRHGWFSAIEAVTYVDLFFQNLASLSPISISFYADHENHNTLILDEPLLCCTILMISSRYHVLPGPGGTSRIESIHSRLWKHCQNLIERLNFGQEKYSTSKLRTLGSIKALLLMTEWHPRALHLPPEHDGWDASLVQSAEADTLEERSSQIEYHDSHLHRWREEVFEPAKRSDRMSWMLLGLATTLAHELGVFEEPDPEDHQFKLDPDTRIRTQRMLFLYISQLSLRIGCTSSFPQNLSLSSTPSMSGQADSATRDRDSFLSQFIEITKLRKTTTELFFPSKSATRQIMKTGRYITLLEHFQPLIAQWYQNHNDTIFTTLSTASKQMLFIDYSYVRMYINSIAIQAIVERARGRGISTILDYDFVKNGNRQEYKFVQEVIDASRSVLSTAIELAESDLLRYCPVRVFISITSASIFLLKAISLGTRQSELDKSLVTLETCIRALRYSTHDDMHLASRYGMLLDRHVRRFKRNFRVQQNATIPTAVQTQPNRAAGTPSAVRDGIQNTGSGTSQGTIGQIDNHQNSDFAAIPNEFDIGMDDWLAQPFDPSFAPFDFDINQAASGLEMNSLDFLWNLPT